MNDPFNLFQLEARFDLDEADLHARYLAASAQTHPDHYTDPIEQAEAADRASQINHAYRILTDPEQRADALLRILGGPAKEDDQSLPPDLLMDMMDIRERMEAAIENKDADELDALRLWADGEREQHLSMIATLFASDPPSLKQVRVQLNALRYIERMLEQMP